MQSMNANIMGVMPANAMQGMDADKMAAMPQNSIDSMNTDQIGMTPADVMQSAALGDIDALGEAFSENSPPIPDINSMDALDSAIYGLWIKRLIKELVGVLKTCLIKTPLLTLL